MSTDWRHESIVPGAEHPVGATPETFALLALMHLHAAKLGACVDGAGGLLLLEEQDRALWEPEESKWEWNGCNGQPPARLRDDNSNGAAA